ncbi:PepSY domain-containing protein [Luteimonas sp. TWI1416]|uniref:PepSY-associated TM helix domain-containing protein n=1 Tax=unclassified Luteimonas TaxID=2629088 RepID=UPI00320B0F32
MDNSTLTPHAANDRYRLFWRWHLYAGLFVAPFLLVLAVTGAIYLFNDELNDAFYPQLRFTSAPWTARVPLGEMIDAAQANTPDATPTRIELPADHLRAAQVHLQLADGASRIAYVDPGDGTVLGVLAPARTLVGIAERLHGSLMLGTFGRYVMELAACWTVLLIVSGLYLGWPRAQDERWWRAVLPKLGSRGRMLWKSIHRATGLWVALLVLFLVATGLPWAVFWGGWIRGGAELVGEGYPAVYRRYAAPQAPQVGDAFNDVPWTLQHAPMPAADTTSAHHGHAPPAPQPGARHWTTVGLERAIAHIRAARTDDELRVFLPSEARGALTAYTYPARPQGQVTYHFDREGTLLVSTGFDDYGVVAQAIELGVQLHMGNYFGRLNQLVMLATCIGVVVLVVTGTTMWWRRRPPGRIGAPGASARIPTRVLLALLLISAIALPLLAASLLVVLAFDRWLRPRVTALRWLR